jgi:hypothetical protein
MLSRRTTDLLPIRLVFRPFDESVGPFDRKNLVLTEGQGVADGFPCVAVRQDDQIFWVDPKRSFIPLRVYRMARVVAPERIGFGEIIFRLAVQYSEDKEFGWIPAAWSIESNHSSTGNLISSTTARVAAYKINSPIPEATFELPFPPGTWVHDRVKNENYILREGGKHRPVLPGEYNGRNYEQIRDSEPPVRP